MGETQVTPFEFGTALMFVMLFWFLVVLVSMDVVAWLIEHSDL